MAIGVVVVMMVAVGVAIVVTTSLAWKVVAHLAPGGDYVLEREIDKIDSSPLQLTVHFGKTILMGAESSIHTQVWWRR